MTHDCSACGAVWKRGGCALQVFNVYFRFFDGDDYVQFEHIGTARSEQAALDLIAFDIAAGRKAHRGLRMYEVPATIPFRGPRSQVSQGMTGDGPDYVLEEGEAT